MKNKDLIEYLKTFPEDEIYICKPFKHKGALTQLPLPQEDEEIENETD